MLRYELQLTTILTIQIQLGPVTLGPKDQRVLNYGPNSNLRLRLHCFEEFA
jgi:hypothetical protein